MIQSYWKSVNLGDPKLAEFFTGSLLQIEEKADGSQFSFGLINDTLFMKSRSKLLDIDSPEKLFANAVNHVKSVRDRLPNNVVFRGEAITSVRHNSNIYSRTPNGYVVIFGAEDAVTGRIFQHIELVEWANVLGVDPIPLLDTLNTEGMGGDELLRHLHSFLDRESYLGGCLVEGIAIKRLTNQIFFMNQIIFAKLVSASFRETQKKDWRKDNPTPTDAIQIIAEEIGTPIRFEKAIMKLKEAGEYTGEVKDIGPLIKVVRADLLEETKEYAGKRFVDLFMDDVVRTATKNIPNWYKGKLQNNLVQMIDGDTES